MSIIDPTKINLAVPDYTIDQIIGVYSNTLSLAKPTSGGGFTLATDVKNHGFGDSAYFEGIFSQDGGTTWNDFGAQTPNLSAPQPFFQSVDVAGLVDTEALNISMVNYYDVVHSTASAYNVEYKAYLIAKNTMAQPINPLSTNQVITYDSSDNYQKIFKRGTVDIVVASGATGSSPSIVHNLGYIPKVRAYYLDSSTPTSVSSLLQPTPLIVSGFPNTVPAVEAHLTTTSLTFYSDQSGFGAPGISGNVEWRIYLDS